MTLYEVDTPDLEKRFLRVPRYIYQHDTHWVEPLQQDIIKIFSPKNHYYHENYCKRWIVHKDGKDVGRIAAFYNPLYKNKGDENLRVGGIGFFESIHNDDVAKLLFTQAKKWLLSLKCDAIDGPINLGERNLFWGLIVEGTKDALYGMNYQPAYYQKFFENFGFQVFYEQYCYQIICKDFDEKSIQPIYERLQKQSPIHIQFLELNKLEKFVHDFVSIYNASFATHEGNKTMTYQDATELFRPLQWLIDERVIFFAYHDEKPVGFFINLPELHFYFKHTKGKITFLSKMHILFKRIFYKNPNLTGILYGIIPEYQAKGIDALFVFNLFISLKNLPYQKYEMQWIGDFNKKMISFARKLGASQSRKLHTYRLILNPQYTFTKHPIL